VSATKPPKEPSFGAGSYRARCERVIDADTAVLVCDLGFNIHITAHFRLLGINAPELHAKELDVRARAGRAKDFTVAWLASALDTGLTWPLRIVTAKGSDDFGRWLARIYRPGAGGGGAELCLNDDLLSAGHAVTFMV
jgi:endonuclease YncB( thermonuclease family)